MTYLEFPTSDEDSSTPDVVTGLFVGGLLLCFRPLTRIHLLLTSSINPFAHPLARVSDL